MLLLQTLFVPQLPEQSPVEVHAIVVISCPAQKQPASIALAPVNLILVESKKDADGVEYVQSVRGEVVPFQQP